MFLYKGCFKGKEYMMTENTDFAILDERLLLGIPVIDKQHANLIRITNNLHFACYKSTETDNFRIIQAVNEAIDYIQYHFTTEEKLMNLADFPGYPGHKIEHENFIMDFMGRFKQLQDDEQDYTPEEFAVFLSKWILYHIGVSDTAFASFFLNMRKYGKLRLILAGELQPSTQSA